MTANQAVRNHDRTKRTVVEASESFRPFDSHREPPCCMSMHACASSPTHSSVDPIYIPDLDKVVANANPPG